MKSLFPATLVASLFCVSPVLRAADSKREVPPADVESAKKASPVGQYSGKWKSTADAGGDLQINIKQDGGAWAAEAAFTFESVEIPTKMKSVEINGTKVQLTFDWVIQGTPGQSKITGELKGDTLQGTYETKGPSDSSRGTWTVTRG